MGAAVRHLGHCDDHKEAVALFSRHAGMAASDPGEPLDVQRAANLDGKKRHGGYFDDHREAVAKYSSYESMTKEVLKVRFNIQ
jgi:hypothetical protein